MTFAIPVSSSIEMKMKPLAVPGRCRAMTRPAVVTNSPSRRDRNSSDGGVLIRPNQSMVCRPD